MFRTKPGRWDLFAALGVVFLACALLLLPLLWQKEGATLVVTTPDGVVGRYALDEDREFTVSARGITLCVVIRDGKAYVLRSDCDDGVCVDSGKIHRSGETIVCAPAGVRLRIEGRDADVDFVAG